ncbi:hypothetical protein D3C71_1829690 [compost metagenome]
MQLRKTVAVLGIGFGGDGHQRRLRGARQQMAVHGVVAQIGGAALKPLGKRRVAVVAHLLWRGMPVNQSGLLGPKGVTVVDGLAVEVGICGHCGCLLGISRPARKAGFEFIIIHDGLAAN